MPCAALCLSIHCLAQTGDFDDSIFDLGPDAKYDCSSTQPVGKQLLNCLNIYVAATVASASELRGVVAGACTSNLVPLQLLGMSLFMCASMWVWVRVHAWG